MNNDNYTVGYCKPPRENQFQKGISGNPNGRPKGIRHKFIDLYDQEMARAITIKENGEYTIITMDRAIIRSIIHAAAKGDTKAAKLCFEMEKFLEISERYINIPPMVIKPPDGSNPVHPPIHGESD